MFLARLPAWCALCSLAVLLVACGGGSGGSAGVSVCVGECAQPTNFLTVEDVKRVIGQAAFEAETRKKLAVIAVTDRVGNVLGVYRMKGAKASFTIKSGREGVFGGLDGVPEGPLPGELAAIAKAVTGAYLSSEGNAFSTRTASQIVQENFNPREQRQPSGPLYGVQFSQLICSDLIRQTKHGTIGPKHSPLGLSADPGGLPLYKNGTVVGGIGVLSDGLYSLDLDIADRDADDDELIAVAGTRGFSAPDDRRADRITADGRTFRFTDAEDLASDPAKAPALDSLIASAAGALSTVAGYNSGAIVAGTAFRTPASGYRPDTGPFAAQGAVILVDELNQNRFPPRDAPDGLTKANEVTVIIQEALKVANRARAQIRRPLGSPVEVTISVVDTNGDVIGIARTRDAPVFGTDVSLQKARGALVFSHPQFANDLLALPAARYLLRPGVTVVNDVPGLVAQFVADNPPFPKSSIADYVARTRTFFNDPAALSGNTAFSMRAVGLIHRPSFPDGILGSQPGPLSTPYSNWSPFHVGFQLDLIYNQLIRSLAAGDASEGCVGRRAAGDTTSSDAGIKRARNGIQIFPGAVPLYRGNQLVGAIGISGDGVDQDDMVAFLGVANASRILGTGIGNAPAAIRADQREPQGIKLRYVQCPQAPFNDSSEQNVCAGL